MFIIFVFFVGLIICGLFGLSEALNERAQKKQRRKIYEARQERLKEEVYDDSYRESSDLYDNHMLGTTGGFQGYLEDYFCYGPFTNTEVSKFSDAFLSDKNMDLVRYREKGGDTRVGIRNNSGKLLGTLPRGLEDSVLKGLESGTCYECERCIPSQHSERVRFKKILKKSPEENRAGLGLVQIGWLSNEDPDYKSIEAAFKNTVLVYPITDREKLTNKFEAFLKDDLKLTPEECETVFKSILLTALDKKYYWRFINNKSMAEAPYSCAYRVFKLEAVITEILKSKTEINTEELHTILEKIKLYCSRDERIFLEPIVKKTKFGFADIFYFDTKISGVTYGDRQKYIMICEEGDELKLVREPNNQYDANAIAVYNEFNKQLGYIPSDEAEELAPRIDAGEKYQCCVSKVIKFKKDKDKPLSADNVIYTLIVSVWKNKESKKN